MSFVGARDVDAGGLAADIRGSAYCSISECPHRILDRLDLQAARHVCWGLRDAVVEEAATTLERTEDAEL